MLSGGELDTEGSDEDVHEHFRYKDDGTVWVHRWINAFQWNSFRGPAKVCNYGELENEDMRGWAWTAIGRI